MNGTPDPDFGVAGGVTTDFDDDDDDRANSVAIQPDGRIVVAGSAIVGVDSDFALARYLGDSSELKFDFNAKKSPTAPGHTAVLPKTLFAGGEGSGWLNKAKAFDDKKNGDPLLRDGHTGRDNAFMVQLAPGAGYTVTLHFRHKKQHEMVDLIAEGVLRVDNFTVPAHTDVTEAFTGTVDPTASSTCASTTTAARTSTS
jgi:hypothetical protein